MVRSASRVPLDGMVGGARRMAVRRLRRTLKAASRLPLATFPLAAARTGRFVGGAWLRTRRGRPEEIVPGEIPEPRLTAALVAQVALDECVLAFMNNPSRQPEPEELDRVGAELLAARDLFRERGWLDDPASYHEAPPVLERPGIRTARWFGLPYERLTFDSGYEPHPGEPGRERWMRYEANRTGYAWVLRHPDGPRPWLVCIHGFGTGRPFMDLYAFRAAFLHRVLGINLAVPVLPMHGPRTTGKFSGDDFMTYDLLNVVHGMSQSLWDIRRVLSWVRSQDPVAVGVHGVSLGGYLTGALAGLDDRLDCAIAGIPVSDLPELYGHHAPERFRRDPESAAMLGEVAADVLRVVSPLALEPLVPFDRRFLYAGLADRMATPQQAGRLWEHWGRPRIAWYDGNHVGFLWSGAVNAFVHEALTSSGIATAA